MPHPPTLGELVAALFEEALAVTADPARAAALAAAAVRDLLLHTGQTRLVEELARSA